MKRTKKKKDRFSGQKWWIGQGTSQPAQPIRIPIYRLYLIGWSPIERCIKPSFSSNSLAFPVEVLSSTNRGLTVTCHTFFTQQLVDRSIPSLTDRGCFLAFWLPRLETYKLRTPLHFEQNNTCIYLSTYLFQPKKLLFFFWCIKSPFAYSLVYLCVSS